MDNRAPLPGWTVSASGRYKALTIGGIGLLALADSYDVDITASVSGVVPAGHSPEIATEDAARALVADMARSLGGSVVWAEAE